MKRYVTIFLVFSLTSNRHRHDMKNFINIFNAQLSSSYTVYIVLTVVLFSPQIVLSEKIQTFKNVDKFSLKTKTP
jgi:hypothetical protein